MISNINYRASEDIEKINGSVREWTGQTQMHLQSNIRRLTSSGKGELVKLHHAYFREFGVINRISFRFPKHGIFVHYGVGRGYKRKNGVIFKTNPSDAKIRRSPKDWFNSTLDQRIPMLADMVVNFMADAAVNATNAKIR